MKSIKYIVLEINIPVLLLGMVHLIRISRSNNRVLKRKMKMNSYDHMQYYICRII